MHYAIPGEQRQPQPNPAAPAVATVTSASVESAVHAVLCDVDGTGDWLADACCYKRLTDEQRVKATRLQLHDQPVHVLWAAALLAVDRGDRSGTYEAMRLLKDRLLVDKDAFIGRRAGEIASGDGWL